MTTTLTACVHVPQLLVQLAVQQLAVASPLAVVADDAPHTPILDCCMSARRAGITPGMPATAAHARCSRLTTVTLAPSIVDTAHATITAMLQQFGDGVLPWSRTSWFLELRALGTDYTHAGRHAAHLQQAVTDATGFQIVLALAPTRIVGQVAVQEAGARNTFAPVIVLPGQEMAFLAPLPLDRMPLVGARTLDQLGRLGVTTIGQLASLPLSTVVQILGARGALLHQQARGLDVTRGAPSNDGLESTWHYGSDACADPQRVHVHVQRLTERIGRCLRAQEQAAGRITVAVQWVDGRTQQRTERFPSPADLDIELTGGSHQALGWILRQRRLAVHAVTVRLEDVGPQQQTLFDSDPRLTERQRALDQIKHRHGTSAILFAWMLSPS